MLSSLCVLVLIGGVLWLFEKAAERRDLHRFPRRGHFVADRIHAVETGRGDTTVLLESGLAASSLSWVLTQPLIAEFAHVVSYDRAGLGWSVPSSESLSLDNILRDLDTISGKAQQLILVGHSFGGLIVSAFAHAQSSRMKGIVLVDPVSLATYSQPDMPSQKRLKQGAMLSRRGAWLAHFAIVRAALAMVAGGSRKLPLLIGRISAGKGSSVMNRLASEVAKLPADTHGAIRAHWSRPGSFLLMAEYLELVPHAAREALTMPIPLEIPVIVLSASTATAAELAERDSLVRNRPYSSHTQIPNTTHWIQLDRPDLVAESVRQLMTTKVSV